MRTATKAEYYNAKNTPHADTRRMMGQRYYDEHVTLMGRDIATMNQILTRGKVSSVAYMVNPDYIT